MTVKVGRIAVLLVAAALSSIVAASVASAAPAGPAPYRPAEESAPTAQTGPWHVLGTPMRPRLQWNANFGYCGETSFISAGMLHGQYTSQWTARALAKPRGVPQTKARSQLLLGTGTEVRAAQAMRLQIARFPESGRQATVGEFLAWVKQRFIARDAVIIGVLNNTTMLGEPGPGDPDYDHIVPVFGIGSSSPLRPGAGDVAPTDTITISDNGLVNIGPNYPFLFTYSFGSFPRTRAQANAPGGPMYSLRNRPPNYGTAVSGVVDPQGVTLPVRLTSDARGEGVQNEPVMRRPPRPFAITLTARVTITDPTQAYRVYLYDDFGDVPTRDFNAHADRAVASWTIPAGSGDSWEVAIRALSSDTRVFRAVPVSAP